MRKILSFVAAMLVAFAANATTWNITPTHCHEGDRTDGYTLYVTLARGAQAGDTIVLADGTYQEGQSIPVDAPVVIMAAKDAKPVVVMNGYFQVRASMDVQGIKFQCKEGGQGYCFYFYKNSAKYLKLDNCEFVDFTQYCVSSWEAYHIDSCIVNNCYFHDLAKAPFYFAKSTLPNDTNACDNLTVKNSTFANITLSDVAVLDLRNNNNSTAATSKLRVDHCTFYNCKGYERMIQSYKSPDAEICNCIMMNPLAATEEADIYATYLYGGSIHHNLNYQTKRQYGSGVTVTDSIQRDPQFVDAANLDLHLALTSPAIGAGSDGSTLGDPRWWPVIGAPEYYLVGTMNNWTPAEAYKFEENPGAEGEYMLTAALAAGDSIKVVEVVGNTKTWYPDQAANYVVDADHAGATKKIYFRPDGQGGEGWYYGLFFVEENPAPELPLDSLTSTFTKATVPANNAVTDLDSVVTWSIATVVGAGAPAIATGKSSSIECLKFGSSKDVYFSKITFSTEYFNNYKVTGVKLNVANNGKKVGKLTVVQGNDTIGTASADFGATWTELVATGNKGQGGNLQVIYEVAQASYWSSIEVFYEKAEQPIVGEPEYYLVGSLNNWTPDATYKFAKNPANENEYMLATTLAVGDSIKVLEIVGNTRTYYPDGMDNHYTVDAAHAGEKTIYFQTTYKADWAEFGGYMWIDANVDTIPTTAPAAPTAAEDDVLAIYCGKYNNNLHFTLAGWDGTAEDLDVQGTRVGYRRAMTWECVIDPVKTDSAHDFSGYKKLHADFWAPKAAKIKFTAEAVAGGNYKDGQVVNLAAGWNSFDFNVAEWPGNYDFKNVKCFVLEQYQNPEGASFEGNPFALANIYFYEKDIPQPEWAVIKFNQVVPKDSLAADASFILLGSDFKAQITDTDNKMEIDANACRFGEAAGYDMFSHRLKTGGKSSATKSYITVSIPETGKLAIAVRTGSNSATDRNLVVKQGNDTLYNQIILESQAIKVMEDTTEVSVYPYIMLPVDSGTVVLSYPVGALNFYAFAFKKEQPIIGPEYYLAGNMNDWKAAEGYKFAANPAAEGEYMLTTTLALGNEFKVLGTGSIENTWYPGNAGNYVVTADYVGEKTIYFRPAGNPDWEGFHAGGYFYMEANPAPAGKITCDSVYNLAKGDTVALAPVTVTYANGKNLYVKDAMGAMLVYLGANGTWKAGDVLSNVEGVLDIYNGLYEVKTDTNQMKAITAVEGPVPAPELLDTIRLADVNKYIKIKDIQVAADTAIHSSGKATNINIIFDEDTIVLRNNFLLEQAFEAGKKYDITGVISYYVAKGASVGTLQVFPTAIEEQQIIGAPEYYLAGSMNGWAANADYKFAENPAKEGEYMLTTALALNDEFKVIGVVGATTTWYPTGMGNNYKVDADHAGAAKTIYFNPNGGQEGWYEGYFYVEPNVVPMENPIDTTKFFTGAEWTIDTQSTAVWDAENQKVVVDIALPKVAQWQGQLWLKLPMEVKVDKEYDLAFKIKANKTFEGTIVKYQENAEMLIDWNLALTADVETVYEKKNMPGVLANGGVTGNGVLCIDFGFAPAETHIEIYEIAIVEHDPTTAPAKFYVTGNDAFTVDAGLTTADSWNSKAFKSESDTMTFALKAGAAYQLKVCVDGTWSTVKGYNDLTEVTPGIIDADGGNHNIGFSLVEDGDVMVIYTGEVFKVVGNFVTQGLNDIDASVKAVKVLRNGQIFILRGDKVYTVTGQPVK